MVVNHSRFYDPPGCRMVLFFGIVTDHNFLDRCFVEFLCTDQKEIVPWVAGIPLTASLKWTFPDKLLTGQFIFQWESEKRKIMKTKKFLKCTPHLPVKNLKTTLDYYRDILGFRDEWVFGEKDGGIRRDELRLLFGEDERSAHAINGSHHCLSLMWFVDNIDEVYKEFTKRGITLAADLRTHPYDLREFAFVDINGYYIRIAEAAV